MKKSIALTSAQTSTSVENFGDEREEKRKTFLKPLHWDNYEKIRVVGKGIVCPFNKKNYKKQNFEKYLRNSNKN